MLCIFGNCKGFKSKLENTGDSSLREKFIWNQKLLSVIASYIILIKINFILLEYPPI